MVRIRLLTVQLSSNPLYQAHIVPIYLAMTVVLTHSLRAGVLVKGYAQLPEQIHGTQHIWTGTVKSPETLIKHIFLSSLQSPHSHLIHQYSKSALTLGISTTHVDMSNMTSTLAKRLRTHSISLPIKSSQHTLFSKSFNVEVAKLRTAEWEPTLPLADLKTNSQRDDDGDNGAEVAQMITYSAFDPGASHPLLLSSALLTSISSPSVNTPTISTLHFATEVQQTVLVVPVAPASEMFKPWPYFLPKMLQPKVGTTYDLMYGHGVGAAQVGKVKVGLLQKVLYGDPKPEK